MVGLFKPSLTLGASKFWNSNPRVQNMRTEWKTTKYQQSENNEKKWNQVLKLASKTRKAKSQMDPFQNIFDENNILHDLKIVAELQYSCLPIPTHALIQG